MTASRTRWAAGTFVATFVLFSIFMPGSTLRGVESGALPLLITYAVVMMLAEQFRLDLPGRLPTSAMSAAAGMALAVTTRTPSGMFLTSSAEIIVTALVGQLAGLGLLLWRGRVSFDDPEAAMDGAIRLFSVAVAAALVREVPLFGGQSLEIASYTWPGWTLALVLIAIGALTALFETPLRSAGRSAESMTWRQATSAEVRASFQISTATTATGALVALTTSVLGLAAIPLVLLFLGLADFAVRRFVQVRETYAQSTRALASMPEVIGYVAEGHGERVDEVTRLVAREMRLPEREILALSDAALLHDLGQLDLRRVLPRGATVQAAPSDQQRIADSGARLIRAGGPPGPLGVLLSTQAVPYHRVMSGRSDVPLGARIIKVANAFDDYGGRLGADYADERRSAMERIYLGLGYEYDPRVVDALSRVLARLDPTGEPHA